MTGAIFARGSCRALMWVLALAAVVALSAGEAAAQATATVVSESRLEVEEGSANSFTVTLDGTPAAEVAITVTRVSVDSDANFQYTVDGTAALADAATPSTLTFAANTAPRPRLITVNALDDTNSANGEEVLSITGLGSPKTVRITEDDHDETRVNVAPRSLTIREGGMGTYSIVLGSEPGADVTVSLRVSNRNANVSAMLKKDNNTPDDDTDDMSHASIVFAPETGGSDPTTALNDNIVLWNATQTITVMAGADVDTVSGSATIRHSVATTDAGYAGVSAPSVSVKEIDSVRTVTMAVSADTVMEGESVNITATLGHPEAEYTGPLHLSENVTVSLSLDHNPAAAGSWSFAGSSSTITIMAGQIMGTSTMSAEHDGDDNDESLSFSTTLGGSTPGGATTVVLGDAQKVKVKIEDDDTYKLAASQTEVNEGDEVTLTVEVDPKAALDTDVKIELYRASGATVVPGPGDVPDYVTIMEGETKAEFMLKTAKDADSQDETIVARAKVGGASVGQELTIMVLDGQVYTLSVEPDAIGEADGEATVMVKIESNKAASEDMTLTLAVDATSTAMAMDDYSIMPEMMEIMIAEGEKMGMAELMVTPVADGMDEANETIVLTAWKGDAQVGNAATLTIIDGDSTTFTLSGPSDMNLVEGFEYDIEVMASSPVKADTTIMIMAGEGSTATAEDDYMIEDIMIMAGETMGRTKLMVKRDDMPDGGTDGSMAETLVLYGMVGNMRTNDLSFYIWDLAVPALPVIAQLLLAALMAVGGYRRYRRR